MSTERKKEQPMSSKMREALEKCTRRLDAITSYLPMEFRKYVFADIKEAKEALAEPVRNCDVGTAEEQEGRFLDFCDSHDSCMKCPLIGTVCEIRWSQMPYEEGDQA
jgi:hypothetical protein